MSVSCLIPLAHYLGLFFTSSLVQDLTSPGHKQSDPLTGGGDDPRFVILPIALSAWGLTEAYLRGRSGLLPTRQITKQLPTCLADEDIISKLCSGRVESPGHRHSHVLKSEPRIHSYTLQ